MKKTESEIPYHYKTIRITQSRINKGLLAIPVSLIDYFPKDKKKIQVFYGDEMKAVQKNFTPYKSTSRECRIGGMGKFYSKFNVEDGEELVVQFIDENQFRILTENQYITLVLKFENDLDLTDDEGVISTKLENISLITGLQYNEIIRSEFSRLSKERILKRKYNKSRTSNTKEGVPISMRKILMEIYDGKCQISGFGFLKKNGQPYFELHHIQPNLGNHLKNLLVLSPNVHAQFTFANVKEFFDEQGWLRKVIFNDDEFSVNHIIDDIPSAFQKETHFF